MNEAIAKYGIPEIFYQEIKVIGCLMKLGKTLNLKKRKNSNL